MQTHEHAGPEQDALRPKGSRIDERPEGLLLEAAAAGRTDVLGTHGLQRLQRAVGNAGASALVEEGPSVSDVTSRAGSPLPDKTRTEMESRLGADFSDVRVHTDSDAHESASSVNAHAYTAGNNVVFQRGMYDTESHAGKTMLAHELTHVIQQRSGPVDGTDRGDGVKVSDPSDRFEREASSNADRVMSAPAPVQRESAEEDELQTSAVQRESAEEDELQMSAVQREEAPESEGEELQMSAIQRHADHDPSDAGDA